MANETLTIDKPQAEAPNAPGVTTEDKSTPRHQDSKHKSSFWGLFGGKPAKETPHMVTEEVPNDSSAKPPLMESTPEGVIEGAEAFTREAEGDTQPDSDGSQTTPDSEADTDVDAKMNEEVNVIDSPSASEDPQLASSDTESPTITDESTGEGDSSSSGDSSATIEGTPSDTDVRVDGGALDTDIGGTAVREGQESVTVSDGSPFEGQDSPPNDRSEDDGANARNETDELPIPEGQDNSDSLGLEGDDLGDESRSGQPKDQLPQNGENSPLPGSGDNFGESPTDQTDQDAVAEDDTLITAEAKLQQQLDEGNISQEEYQTKMTELTSKTNVDSSGAEIGDEPQAEQPEDAAGNTETPAEAVAENEGVDPKAALENYDNFFMRLVAAGIDPGEAEDLRAKAKANPEQLPDFLKMLDDIEAISKDVVTSYETHDRNKSLDEALADTTDDFLKELAEDNADASHEKADLLKLYTEKLKKDDKVAA